MFKTLLTIGLYLLVAEGYVAVARLDAFLDREISYQRKIYLELVNLSHLLSDKKMVGRGGAYLDRCQ